MGREIKRVPLDFSAPLYQVWTGYECPPGHESSFVRIDPPSGQGYQVWETVSEGSPVSPVFSNEAELREWLTGQGYRPGGIEEFIRTGYSITSTIFNGSEYGPIDCIDPSIAEAADPFPDYSPDPDVTGRPVTIGDEWQRVIKQAQHLWDQDWVFSPLLSVVPALLVDLDSVSPVFSSIGLYRPDPTSYPRGVFAQTYWEKANGERLTLIFDIDPDSLKRVRVRANLKPIERADVMGLNVTVAANDQDELRVYEVLSALARTFALATVPDLAKLKG